MPKTIFLVIINHFILLRSNLNHTYSNFSCWARVPGSMEVQFEICDVRKIKYITQFFSFPYLIEANLYLQDAGTLTQHKKMLCTLGNRNSLGQRFTLKYDITCVKNAIPVHIFWAYGQILYNFSSVLRQPTQFLIFIFIQGTKQ